MYSRATTSEMADLCLPAGFFPAALVDISILYQICFLRTSESSMYAGAALTGRKSSVVVVRFVESRNLVPIFLSYQNGLWEVPSSCTSPSESPSYF